MEYFLSAFWTLLDIISLHYFIKAFLPVKTSKKAYFLSFLCAWLLPIIFTFIDLHSAYGKILAIGLLVFISIYNFEGSFLKKVLIIVLSYTLLGLVDAVTLYGTSTFLGISLAVLVWRKATYTLIVTIGKAIAVLLAWTICRIRKNQQAENPQHKWLLLSLLFPVASLIMLLVLFYGSRNQEDISAGIVVFCAVLVLANVAIIYLIQLMEKSTAESKKLALLNQQMEIQTDSILALEQNYRAQRQATHEFHNQLQTIAGLLAGGETDRAAEYILALQDTHPTRILSVNSHHPVIDAILNYKYQIAYKHGIDIRMELNDLSGVSIGTNYLVVLLSNLLDNAIEACLRYDGERIIQCRFIATDSFFLSVRNTSVPVVIIDNHIPTSKESKADHGYGLAHIDMILKQLKGEFYRGYNDGWFEFAAEIPLPDQTQKEEPVTGFAR